jgi:hypothetical protein
MRDLKDFGESQTFQACPMNPMYVPFGIFTVELPVAVTCLPLDVRGRITYNVCALMQFAK